MKNAGRAVTEQVQGSPQRKPLVPAGWRMTPVSPHRASQKGFVHRKPAPKPVNVGHGQKCLPPHVKSRERLYPSAPMSDDARLASYGVVITGDMTGAERQAAINRLTPAQRKRYLSKLGNRDVAGMKLAASKAAPEPTLAGYLKAERRKAAVSSGDMAIRQAGGMKWSPTANSKLEGLMPAWMRRRTGQR